MGRVICIHTLGELPTKESKRGEIQSMQMGRWEDTWNFYVNSPLCSDFHEILIKGSIWLKPCLILFARLLQQKEMSISYRQEIEIMEKYFENHISKTVGSIYLPFRFM